MGQGGVSSSILLEGVFLVIEAMTRNIHLSLQVPVNWLNCRIPCHFKATPKGRWIRGCADTQSLRICLSTLSISF